MNPFNDRFELTYARLAEVITVGFVETYFSSDSADDMIFKKYMMIFFLVFSSFLFDYY